MNPCASDAPLSNVCQNQFPSKVRGESYPTISWRWVKCILENSCEQQRLFFFCFFSPHPFNSLRVQPGGDAALRTGQNTSSARLGQSSPARTSKPNHFMFLKLWSLQHSYYYFGIVLLNGLFKISFLWQKTCTRKWSTPMVDERRNDPLDGLVFVGPPQFMAAIKSAVWDRTSLLVFSVWDTSVHTPFAINPCAAVVLCHCLRSNVLANTAGVFHHVTFYALLCFCFFLVGKSLFQLCSACICNTRLPWAFFVFYRNNTVVQWLVL